MYIDPLTIYREYVQNAADSIDEARMAGLSLDDPHITIHLDQSSRTVRIRDNGESIPNQDFVKRITAIGASHKRGTTLRGFRGVGRLIRTGLLPGADLSGKGRGRLEDCRGQLEQSRAEGEDEGRLITPVA